MIAKVLFVFAPIFMAVSLISAISAFEEKAEILNPLSGDSQEKVLGENTIAKPILTSTPTLPPTPTLSPTPTPTPSPFPSLTPTPIPTVVTSEELENIFTKYANQYSVDKELLKRIAKCESNFNTNAVFRDYAGLFQFAPSSWISSRTLMGQDSNPDLRFNADEAVKTAAFKVSRGEQNAWPNCSK